METFGGLLDGCFGEAGGLEEATRNSGVASSVESGRGFGFVGSDGGVGIERCGGADFDFNVVEGSFRFDDAMPAEERARFGERGSLAGRFAAIGVRLQGSQSVAVEYEAQYNIATLDVINGVLPRRAHALVVEWASLHKDELMKNWDRCQVPAPTVPIDPLE